ncbi:PREDICTED: kinetochore protein NDC80 homolog [Diuraphis noxia]|uniref:kinetochore protein NDC80 homolog n=1 Tax=Diuraphis noxia TaxID=143948 RepID=UPI0007639961|nr:PREDICTED: kinetochore protein NDC80 homolog [Diuraphis noxia]
MKKASFGRRSSAAGRNTFGTFGRQNSFDGNDIKLSRRESRGMEKKSLLLKPGFSAKKRSASSDNLSAHDPKQWSSTVKKPANQQRNTLVRSTTSMNITGINLVASTPCVTPGLNPNLPGINSSYKNRRLSSESRYSNYGGVLKNRKEVRPLTEKDFQQTAIYKVLIINASHSFPQVVGLLLWLVELCETQNRFNVMDTLYPTILDPDESEDEDYEQTVEFKMYLPFLLNSYQVESRGSNKPADQEFLKKQEELLLENYKKTLGVDEELLIKLEAEVNSHKEELDLLNDLTEEQKLEEMKAMKVALQKDIVNSKKYIKDLQTCHGEVLEYISKKKDERVYQEKDIENLQRELNAVNSCINGQQITQVDKKNIEEDIISLKQDIQYETNCLEEYSNIVYSEDLNVVDVRLKVSKLFVQYNKLCAENIVVLPELENAIADKNVLALHIRESLKEVDELLKSLKTKNVEKLKEVEHKMASIQIELDSAELEYNKLKKIAEKLGPERDADKKRLLEITDRQFEVIMILIF